MQKKKNPRGRPPAYATPEALQEKIDAYFDRGVAQRKVIVGPPNNRSIEFIPVPTITGLVLYCGFCDRTSFYDMEKKPEFAYTIKNARTRIEQNYEELAQTGLGAGAIFALKNFGWIDKTEIDHTLKEYAYEDFASKTPRELEQMADELRKKRLNGSESGAGVSLSGKAKSA